MELDPAIKSNGYSSLSQETDPQKSRPYGFDIILPFVQDVNCKVYHFCHKTITIIVMVL